MKANATREPVLKAALRQAARRIREHQQQASASSGAVSNAARIEAYKLRRIMWATGATARFPVAIY